MSADGLVDWYAPHVAQWSKRAKPSTSLWFWNTEVGWATVHPLLEANGWEYVQLVTWDKGLSHIAGNVNGNTIRQFPVVTEVSALYRRRLTLPTEDGGVLGVQQWLRAEWRRSGLPLCRANEACGVKTRPLASTSPPTGYGIGRPGKWSNAWPNTRRKRQAHQPSLLLHRRAYRNHGRTMGLPPCRMEPCQRTH